MINGRYEITGKLGSGRSQVFLCIDKGNSNKETAIKVLSNNCDADDLASFLREFDILKRTDHPNIIKAIEFGTALECIGCEIIKGSKFYTLEYFPGKDLLSVENYTENALSEIIIQISSFLFYLHQSNYIYYDLKPENILVTWAGQKPVIKIIDFGFCNRVLSATKENPISGTAEYIAPEPLRGERHDHRVDLYSLGMMLYRLVYKKLPFGSLNEIEIYKAQIENEFEFPATKYSEKLVRIIKKLLSKNPDQRYYNTVEILDEIDRTLIPNLSGTWAPVKVFEDRTDAISILNTYFRDKTSSEIFSVKGSEGSGKSSLLNNIASEYNEAVLISYNKARPGFEFIKELLTKILYNEVIYNSISFDLKTRIKEIINSRAGDIAAEIKAVFSILSQDCNFFILIDNFSDIDELVYDAVVNIIPILQVNKRKLVIAEDPDIRILSEKIFNLREINLTSFTEVNLTEFIEKSYYDKFPREELKKIILQYADLLPGNIQGFIKDILLLDIINYRNASPSISEDESTIKLLQSSHDEIYDLRIAKLSKEELYTAELVSVFDIPVDQNTVSIITGYTQEEVEQIVFSLMMKNIFLPVHITNLLNFTAGGLKSFIYKTVKDKIGFHSKIAEKIKKEIRTFSLIELARQFELSYRFKESYEVIKDELSEAEKISAFSHMKKILRRYLSFPLGYEDKSDIKSYLVTVLSNLSEFNNAIELINELLVDEMTEKRKDGLLILKVGCLIGSENYDEGKKLLTELLSRITDPKKLLELLPIAANAEYELNNFEETKNICRKLIEDNNAGLEEKGKCYNLLGLISIIVENNLSEALACFELAENVYEDAGLLYKVAQMEMNMGNIYNMKGEYLEAEEYWNKSLELTLSIGNLELEAKLLLNFGIHNYEKPDFENAMEYYNRANTIFVSLGNSSGQGLIQYNIAETLLLTCEFEKAIDAVGNSIKIFAALKNVNEELESLFLYGKICFNAGDYNRLQIITEEMGEKIKYNKVIEKHRINYNLLKQINPLSAEKGDEPLISIRDWYREKEEKNNYFFSSVLVINHLISAGHYDDAFDELEDNYFTGICLSNKLYYAEKDHLAAIISIYKVSAGNPVDYLMKAYEFISEFSITELTWKVLFKLAEIYFERGNFSKSKEFNIYAVSVLDYIFNINKNIRLKRLIMEQGDREAAYNKLKLMQSKY